MKLLNNPFSYVSYIAIMRITNINVYQLRFNRDRLIIIRYRICFQSCRVDSYRGGSRSSCYGGEVVGRSHMIIRTLKRYILTLFELIIKTANMKFRKLKLLKTKTLNDVFWLYLKRFVTSEKILKTSVLKHVFWLCLIRFVTAY